MIYERVALIGLGLIAGSMGLRMKRDGLAGEIVGTARSAKTRDMAVGLGLCDRVMVVREGRISGEVAGHEMTEENIMRLASVMDAQAAAF